MGRVMIPTVVPPPTHSIVIWRRSLLPSPATITRWMICRTISLRSAIVVVGACQRAGTLCASCAQLLPLRRRQELGLLPHPALTLLLQAASPQDLHIPLLCK